MNILMMVKNRDAEYDTLFLKAARRIGIHLDIVCYTEVIIKLVNGSQVIIVGNKELADYDLVFFRTVSGYHEVQFLMSKYCNYKKIPVVDRVFQHKKPWIGTKASEYALLSAAQQPIIDSVFVSYEKLSANSKTKYFNFPIVVKLDGSKGNGVFLCNSPNELKQLMGTIKSHVIIQPYIQNDGDIRLVVIGRKVVGTIKRMRQKKDEFRNNMALGAIAEPFSPFPALEQIAVNAASVLQYDIAGVDLIFDAEQKKWKILEVNRGPQFLELMKAVNVDIPTLILRYLQKQVK